MQLQISLYKQNMINDQTPITSDILVRNGWNEDYDRYWFENMCVEVKDGFSCWLYFLDENIGEPFYTIGELKAIAKALYKVELKFE